MLYIQADETGFVQVFAVDDLSQVHILADSALVVQEHHLILVLLQQLLRQLLHPQDQQQQALAHQGLPLHQALAAPHLHLLLLWLL